MPKFPGVNHLNAVRALEKAGFRIVRQGKHIVWSDGTRKVVIPRHNPVNAITMSTIIRDANLTPEGFRRCSEQCPARPHELKEMSAAGEILRERCRQGASNRRPDEPS